MKLVSVVVPMYNEADMAEHFLTTLNKVFDDVKAKQKNIDFEIIAVNDGSGDNTLPLLKQWHEKSDNMAVVSLSRNFGQEAAIFAGLEKAKGEAVIVIDCDMQDPPDAIGQMIEKWQGGADVVNAQRACRKTDGSFKRKSAGLYYRFLNRLSDRIKYPSDVNNFRLISKKVLDVILAMPEKNKFYRGLVPYAGFKTETVLIEREKRLKGQSKYNVKSMMQLAARGIASTSVKPLSWAFYTGLIFSVLSAISAIILIVLCALNISANYTLFGIITAMAFFSGIIMIFLGIIGFYLGNTLQEVKARPLSITSEYLPVQKINYR